MFIPKAISYKKQTLEEFLEMLDDKNVLDQTLSVREARICYIGCLPMMEQVTITPQFSMSFYDFIEALIRAANIIYDSLDIVEDEDEHIVIPMLRPIRDDDSIATSEEMESVANILDHFINDLICAKVIDTPEEDIPTPNNEAADIINDMKTPPPAESRRPRGEYVVCEAWRGAKRRAVRTPRRGHHMDLRTSRPNRCLIEAYEENYGGKRRFRLWVCCRCHADSVVSPSH